MKISLFFYFTVYFFFLLFLSLGYGSHGLKLVQEPRGQCRRAHNIMCLQFFVDCCVQLKEPSLQTPVFSSSPKTQNLWCIRDLLSSHCPHSHARPVHWRQCRTLRGVSNEFRIVIDNDCTTRQLSKYLKSLGLVHQASCLQ